MSHPTELFGLCVVAEGFPKNVCPAEIVKVVKHLAGVTVKRLVRLGSDDPGHKTNNNPQTTSRWLLCLTTHNEQKKCLHTSRKVQTDDFGIVTFHFPATELEAENFTWINLEQEEIMEERMSSVKSADMFGSGHEEDGLEPSRSAQYPAVSPHMSQYQYPPGYYYSPQQMYGKPGMQDSQRYTQEPQIGETGIDHQPCPENLEGYHPSQQYGVQQVQQWFGSMGRGRPYFQYGVPRYDSDPIRSVQSDPDEESKYKQSGMALQHAESFASDSICGPDSDFEDINPHFYLQVTDLPEDVTEAELTQFFSNRNVSGGGQVTKVQLDLAKKSAAIYFANPDTIDSVIRRAPLLFKTKKITVEIASINLHQTEEIKTVEVRNLCKEDQEMCSLYFENPKKGGGEIKSLEWSEEEKVFYITFADPKVAKAVTETGHKLNGKVLEVSLYQPPAEEESYESEPQCTVEVQGIDPENFELYEMYFSNPRKGGGTIEEIWLSDNKTILYIKFEKPEVAKAIAEVSHKVGSKVLQVSLYQPPAEEEEIPASQPPCTVEVRGIDPDSVELYEMYFSNPNKGGDTIKEIVLSEDQTVLYVTFETPEVAKRVASKAHTVGNKQLEVVIAPVEDPSTIVVAGCDRSQEEMLGLYFGNPKKGGGEIEEIKWDEDLHAFRIVFEDQEVAQTVLKSPHKLSGRELCLSKYKPSQKKQPAQGQCSQAKMEEKIEEEEEEEEEEEAPLKTVVFQTGSRGFESRDTYELYFESSRHGGGDVEEIRLDEDKKLVFVTFEDPAVAKRVAEKSHRINGIQLEVELYIPPKPRPVYPNKLLFKNVADSTTKDCLAMYIERVTGQEPQEILYGDEVGTVLISFDEVPDLVKTQQMCQKKKLEGRQLTVSKVPISNCLLVENLNNTTSDTIELYFEGKRSGGSEIEKVEMVPEERKCFVYYKNHEVLDTVLSKTHRIDGALLTVKRYMECLGQSGGNEDPTSFIMPKPVVFRNVNPYKLAFLRQSTTACNGLVQQLQENHAEIKFHNDQAVIECKLTTAVPQARIIARTWEADARKTMDDYLSLLDVHNRAVMQQLWDEVAKAVSSENIQNTDGALMFSLPKDHVFVVVGMKSLAKELFGQVCSTITATEDAIERRNQEVTETNTKLRSHQLRLLLAIGFQTEAPKRHEGLKVKIELPKNAITFHGLMKDVKEAQVEMYEMFNNIKTEKITGMSDIQKRLLDSKDVKPYIVQKFKQDGISAVWEMAAQEISVYSFDDPSLVKATHIIKKAIPEHALQLSSESSELLQTSNWQNLVKGQMSRNQGVLSITPAHDGRRLFITCTDNVMHGVVEEVERFLQENTIYSQVVRFSPSRQQFVNDYCQQKLLTMQSNLQAYRVQVTMKEGGREIFVKGTTAGLSELRKLLENLSTEIICHEEVLKDRKMVRFVTSETIDRDLRMLSQAHRCIIALEPEPASLQVEQQGGGGSAGNFAQTGGSVRTLSTVQLPSGVSVSAVVGDITQLSVDIIVNAANNKMEHIGGLARDIVQKGGQEIQDECTQLMRSRGQLAEGDILLSGAGRLQCKAIAHAVGPVFRGGYSGEEDCLHDTVMKCLGASADNRYTSIALPAISTGIFKYPPREATRVITEALRDHFDSHRKSSVRSVYLCHLTDDVVQMFADAMDKVFSGMRTSQNATQKTVGVRPSAAPRSSLSQKMGGNSGSSHRVIRVEIMPGEIAKETADVIVNSTSNGLDLQNGAVSSSMLNEAGSGLQDECRHKYPKGIQTGDIACTRGHKLHCKEVYHMALCNFSNPNAEQILGSLIVKCLAEASRNHYTSIAFPVLGTGNLGFPPKIVANTMLGAIDQFQQATPSTSLRDAKIVVYPSDQKNLQEFQKASKKIGGSSGNVASVKSSQKPVNRKNRTFENGSGTNQAASPSKPDDKADASAEFEVGSLRLIIKQGDITEEKVHVIVNSTNAKLDLTRGNVASALKNKSGPELVRECASKVSDITDRGITHTRAYKLPSKMIVHIDAEAFSKRWDEGIRLCLKEAENLGATTMAVPALGTGAFGQTPNMAARDLFSAVASFSSSSKTRTLNELRVVLFDIKMVPQYIDVIESEGNKLNAASSTGIFAWVKSAMFGSSTPSFKQTYTNPDLDKASLFIYTMNKAGIPSVIHALNDIVKERFTRKEIMDETLMDLKDHEIARIQQVQQHHQVEINVQKLRGKVTVDGLQNEVFEAVQKISKILRDVERGKQEEQAASMLANMVQWSFLEVSLTETKPVDYGPKINHIIEMAYKNKKKSATICDSNGQEYIVDFTSMMEYPVGAPSDTATVLRRDKIKDLAVGSIPETWATHTNNENIKIVDLASTDTEYQNVVTAFQATLGNAKANITAISRIQNRTLYQQYAAKKSHLDKQNTNIQNEKTLWHGTAADAIENINNYGFNRSYCGKNATVYGDGVYFAVNSNYSAHATYSPPDSSANRHIYQCKVLVGHPCQGTRGLRVLPMRQPPLLYDSATDNLANPSMYVIFNDTQAYPEYLITFK